MLQVLAVLGYECRPKFLELGSQLWCEFAPDQILDGSLGCSFRVDFYLKLGPC